MAAAALSPRDVEWVLRGMTGETELLTAVPGEDLAEISLVSLLGLADELALDDRAGDALLVEAERETAALAAVEEPPDTDEAAVPDGDRWRRTFEGCLTSDDFVPRAHPGARRPRPFPVESGGTPSLPRRPARNLVVQNAPTLNSLRHTLETQATYVSCFSHT